MLRQLLPQTRIAAGQQLTTLNCTRSGTHLVQAHAHLLNTGAPITTHSRGRKASPAWPSLLGPVHGHSAVYSTPVSMAAAGAVPSLVSVRWLRERLDDPNIRILDASWHMPNANRDPKAEFGMERIPGARFFDVDAISDNSDLPHMLPSPEVFAAAADALGITNDSQVVLYDKAGIFSAPRVWWTFSAFGHERVSVLNGGFPAWSADGAPIDSSPCSDEEAGTTSAAAASPPASGGFRATLKPALVRSAEEVRANVDSRREAVVDARSPGRFYGSAPEPRSGIPSGHIPGSANVPFSEVLTTDGRYRPPEELQSVFEDAGVDLGKPVIASCGTGVTASILALALAQLPTPPPGVAVYDGSWTEWGAREDLPKATGKN